MCKPLVQECSSVRGHAFNGLFVQNYHLRFTTLAYTLDLVFTRQCETHYPTLAWTSVPFLKFYKVRINFISIPSRVLACLSTNQFWCLQVEKALSHVDMKNKEAAYQAWLGYYNSNKKVGRDKFRLVELANEFSRSMGLDNPPAIAKLVLGKMGLRNIPGLRAK